MELTLEVNGTGTITFPRQV